MSTKYKKKFHDNQESLINIGQENLKKSLQKIRLEQFKANSKLNSYPIKTKPKTTLIIFLAINSNTKLQTKINS